MDYNNQPNNVIQNNYTNGQPVMIPPEYRPISMWGYFGYELLFSIPCIGFILLIVFSLGGTKNINLRNFARSYFCFLVIMVIVFGALVVMGGIGSTVAAYLGKAAVRWQ